MLEKASLNLSSDNFIEIETLNILKWLIDIFYDTIDNTDKLVWQLIVSWVLYTGKFDKDKREVKT